MPGPGQGGWYCHFLLRQRWVGALLALGLIVLGGYFAWQVPLSSTVTEYYPDQHPHIQLYQEFPEMLKMTNAVVVMVSVADGTIYTSDTLAKIHRITIGLLETPGVNPHAVMSITHKRLQDIKVRNGMISLLPVVRDPGEPLPPKELERVKNAVYTNLGIRGIYVSPDDKTALIRAGFWDGEVKPQAVFQRLRAFAEQEGDANTEIAFAGNMVLAGWLVDAAPWVVLILLLSAGIALALAGVFGQGQGGLHAIGGVIVVNLLGAAGGFGLLGLLGRSLEPLALLMLCPLCFRGIWLVISWAVCSCRPSGQAALDPEQAIGRAASTLWRPSSWAVCVDGLGFLGLVLLTDVPAVRTFGLLGVGWLAGLLVALWIVLPVWSSGFQTAARQGWGARFVSRLAPWLGGGRQSAHPARFAFAGVGVVGVLGVIAALQLEAGQSMLGSRLFPPSHPYSHAFNLLNEKFIGLNQLIVVAHTPGEAGFRDLSALQALEAFQYHMAVDDQFGGAVAVPGFVKSITRMFHENIPKWAMLPDDISSTGQIIFRVVAGATTPSEVERFISKDFRTTAVTLFYRDYSPALVKRTIERIQTFQPPANDGGIEFRFGGGLLGVVAAIYTAVEHSYWMVIGSLVVLSFVGGWFGLGSLRAASRVAAAVILSQAVLLGLLWLANIDLNIHTLPVVLASAGTILLPAYVAWPQAADVESLGQALTATACICAGAVVVWFLSPLRLQMEMALYLMVVAMLQALIPLRLQALSPAVPQAAGDES